MAAHLPLTKPSKLERMVDAIEELLDDDPCADEDAVTFLACRVLRVNRNEHTAEVRAVANELYDERMMGACTVEVARFLIEHLGALKPQRRRAA